MNETQSQVEFKDLQVIHAGQVAALHIQCISTGFINSMGIDFVTSLSEQFLDRELFCRLYTVYRTKSNLSKPIAVVLTPMSHSDKLITTLQRMN